MTKAVVLVGGEGTRLRPLTYTRPKPLLPVVGRSILERKLEHLAAHGIVEVVLSMGYKPDAFRAAFPEGRVGGVTVTYAVEPTPLDTAGAIRFAVGEAGWTLDAPFVVVNGDVLTDLDLTEQLRFHASSGAEATLALTQVEDPSAFGVVATTADGRVTQFVEKPNREDAPTDWINAGTYVLDPSVVHRIPKEKKTSIERETFPLIADEGKLFAVQSHAYWLDAGTPMLFVQANTDWLDNHHHSRSVVGHGASIDVTSTVTRSSVGADVVIGPGAKVTDSVLLPGAKVGAGATVRQSILGARSVVGDGADVADGSVIGDEAVVEARTVLRAERVAVA
jgi:mannose-1-phosphate guanylyltransferase